MNLDGAKYVLGIMAAYWPHFLKGRDLALTAEVWQKFFEDIPAREVAEAVHAYARTDTEGYAPAPGKVRQLLGMAAGEQALSETEAWALVSRALHNGIYGYKAEWEKLPPLVQEAVGAPEMLKEWAMVDADQVQTVIASNFQRSYRAKAATNAERLALSEARQQRLGGSCQGLQAIGATVAGIMAPAQPVALPEPPPALPDLRPAAPDLDAVKDYFKTCKYRYALVGAAAAMLERERPIDWRGAVDDFVKAHNAAPASAAAIFATPDEYLAAHPEELEQLKQLLGITRITPPKEAIA